MLTPWGDERVRSRSHRGAVSFKWSSGGHQCPKTNWYRSWRFSITAISPASHSLTTSHCSPATRHHHPVTPCPPPTGPPKSGSFVCWIPHYFVISPDLKTINPNYTKMVLLVGLRHGTCEASLGVNNDLRYLVGRLRAVWPDVPTHVRGDSGLGVPHMYVVCRELSLSYTFGIDMNSRLRDLSGGLLKEAVEEYEKTGQPQRRFLAVHYRAQTWAWEQPIVIKVEAHAQGTNRRAVVTNRPGWKVLPAVVYDEYAKRGESENRHKKLKSELQADRLSDHRFMANYFRLYLHAAALNLLVRLRQAVVQPSPTTEELGLPAELPTAAIIVCSGCVQSRRRQCQRGHDRQCEDRIAQGEDPGLGLVEDQPVHPVAEEVSRVSGLSGPYPELLLPDRQGARNARQRLAHNDRDHRKMNYPEVDIPHPRPAADSADENRRQPQHHEPHVARVKDDNQIGHNARPQHGTIPPRSRPETPSLASIIDANRARNGEQWV